VLLYALCHAVLSVSGALRLTDYHPFQGSHQGAKILRSFARKQPEIVLKTV